ncbi:hypothetical protein [Rhizobium sp.]
MKKMIVGALAAFVATATFATSADAGVVVKYKSGWRRPAAVVVVRPRVRVYRPATRVYIQPARRIYVEPTCVVKKRVNGWGEVVTKRICY